MKIRSITYFCQPHFSDLHATFSPAGEFIKTARAAYQAAGYEVQTTRLATTPFPDWFSSLELRAAQRLSQEVEGASRAQGIDYISIGPARADIPQSFALIPPILAVTEGVFLAGMISTPEREVSLPAVRACAEVIAAAAPLSADGFANLRFAALANVPPGAPFFPAAYHSGEAPGFALALEAADLAVAAFADAASLSTARQNLVAALEGHARALMQVAGELSRQFTLPFGGLDFSLAPYPEALRSLGTAIERLGVPAVGQHGSLAAAAILADTIDRAKFSRAGFCGVFLPVMEDAVLGARAANGALNLKDLLLYSAVCGTGLDTIPLPGDIPAAEMTPILLDLAVLAHRIDKPLTARLMPIPGKRAGDPTGFDFAYFANTRVMAAESRPLDRYLAGKEVFPIAPRRG